jgi:hypothetical protein
MNTNPGQAGGDSGTQDPRASGAPQSGVTPGGKKRGRKPGSLPEEASSHARFFLANKDSASAGPMLDQEVATEGEAMVEGMKRGVSFFRVEEYKTTADLSGSAPMLQKEPVARK